MGIRVHESGERLLASERLVTAYYVYDFGGKGWAEEMDFIITPGVSEADMNEFADKWAEENLEKGYVSIQWGQPSCGTVMF